MPAAKPGDSVRVHYTGTFDDGEVFDSSRNGDPLEFTVGAGDVIAGFDDAVTGMEPGQEKRVTIPAKDAYGEHRPELVLRIDRVHLPKGMPTDLGEQLQLSSNEGSFVATIVDIEDDHIVVDANHPLAGQNLTFDLELVGIS